VPLYLVSSTEQFREAYRSLVLDSPWLHTRNKLVETLPGLMPDEEEGVWYQKKKKERQQMEAPTSSTSFQHNQAPDTDESTDLLSELPSQRSGSL
jgi:hypothetical protein